MQKITAIGIRVAAIGVAAALCTGCPNPNTYGTPRTTPVGKIQHSVAAEAIGFKVHRNATSTDPGVDGSVTVPTFPTYTLRVGVADTVDIGARIANLSSLGADVKWNFIKSDVFDMAIDPGFQFFHLATTSNGADASYSIIYLNAPLMFGINVSDAVSIVPTIGVTYGWASATVNTTDTRDSGSGTTGVLLRPGIGFDFRIGQKFAIHPEITFLKTLKSDPSTLIYLFGIGFNFGNLPHYGAAAPEEK
jgi:hypothetical protein